MVTQSLFTVMIYNQQRLEFVEGIAVYSSFSVHGTSFSLNLY